MNCKHKHQREGKLVPRRWGSYRSLVCTNCGMWRTVTHHLTDPSEWKPASEYDAATAPMDLS